jgi:hypothetical protein
MNVTALALAAAVVLVGKCAPQVAPETLLNMARVESGKNPPATRENKTGEVPHAADFPAASSLQLADRFGPRHASEHMRNRIFHQAEINGITSEGLSADGPYQKSR